jgi:hypothetical protein
MADVNTKFNDLKSTKPAIPTPISSNLANGRKSRDVRTKQTPGQQSNFGGSGPVTDSLVRLPTMDEMIAHYSLAQKEAMVCLGGDPYKEWKKNSNYNPFTAEFLGFDCDKNIPTKNLLGDKIYPPVTALVMGRELLPKPEDMSIWIRGFYAEWEVLGKMIIVKVLNDPLAKEFKEKLFHKINHKVLKNAEGVMLTIKKIKIVTPKSVLRLQSKNRDKMSETKLERIGYMLGWASNLFKEVKHEASKFFKWVDSLERIKQTVSMQDIKSFTNDTRAPKTFNAARRSPVLTQGWSSVAASSRVPDHWA